MSVEGTVIIIILLITICCILAYFLIKNKKKIWKTYDLTVEQEKELEKERMKAYFEECKAQERIKGYRKAKQDYQE